jgi:hypothetical protein
MGIWRCQHDILKTVSDNWGVRKETWCKKHKQFLAKQTCDKCPDYKELDLTPRKAVSNE